MNNEKWKVKNEGYFQFVKRIGNFEHYSFYILHF